MNFFVFGFIFKNQNLTGRSGAKIVPCPPDSETDKLYCFSLYVKVATMLSRTPLSAFAAVRSIFIEKSSPVASQISEREKSLKSPGLFEFI